MGALELMRQIDEAVRLAESALGPDATAEQVEKVAALLLEQSRRQGDSHSPIAQASDADAVVMADGNSLPGLLAAIANVLADVKCDVMDVAQKTTGGRAMLLFRVRLVESTVLFPELQSRLSAVAAAFDGRVAVHRADIFEAMSGE